MKYINSINSLPIGTENNSIIIKLRGIIEIIKKNLRLPKRFLYLVLSDKAPNNGSFNAFHIPQTIYAAITNRTGNPTTAK